MSRSGKWIEGIVPDGSVYEAARLSLEARLNAVAPWLPLAAAHADQDIEHVHRLRVATRRAIAALKLYRDWLPRRPARWLKKRLRKIRRAAGDARDLDVLAVRLPQELGERAGILLDKISDQRAAAQPAIVAVAQRCAEEGRFQRKVYELLAGMRPHGKSDQDQRHSFRDWSRRQLAELADQFFGSQPGPSDDVADLHRFRIRSKALRYAIELLAPAFGPELRDVHYPVVEHLQELLGRINDHVTSCARLHEWSSTCRDGDSKELLDALVQQERIRLTEGLNEFRQWWTPERAEALRSGIAAIAD